MAAALRGGEDYELLFTVKPARQGRLRAVRQAIGSLQLTRIGVVTKGMDVTILGADGECPLPEGFEHFR